MHSVCKFLPVRADNEIERAYSTTLGTAALPSPFCSLAFTAVCTDLRHFAHDFGSS